MKLMELQHSKVTGAGLVQPEDNSELSLRISELRLEYAKNSYTKTEEQKGLAIILHRHSKRHFSHLRDAGIPHLQEFFEEMGIVVKDMVENDILQLHKYMLDRKFYCVFIVFGGEGLHQSYLIRRILRSQSLEDVFSAFIMMDLGDEDVFLTQNKFSQAFENEELVEYGFFSHHESLDFLNLSEEETTVEKKDTDVSNHSSKPETDSTSNCSDANGPEYRHKLPVTAEEISNLIVSAIPQSTRGHYKWGYNVFSNWQNERRARPVSDNLPIPVEAITQSITEMEPCIRDTVLHPKDEVDAFYFKPLVNYTTDQWFCKNPSRSQYLTKTVKRLCTAVGLEGKRTNHRLRASTATRLYQAGVEEQLICETTGHRSYAVRSYKRTANFQQNESSEILYDKKQKTTTCTETKLQSEEEKTSQDTSHQVVNIESVRRESVAEPTTLSIPIIAMTDCISWDYDMMNRPDTLILSPLDSYIGLYRKPGRKSGENNIFDDFTKVTRCNRYADIMDILTRMNSLYDLPVVKFQSSLRKKFFFL
ncbi:unnamed protein product [Mytilus coruscus]|uniref:Tyr recombinase domain-containing protein n=1 Tax=Mytilus coruscus TaxID=42192 RepID=A0A6J8DS30_MYTCO|nr:unnamed protein product [Mytilus coruscus]